MIHVAKHILPVNAYRISLISSRPWINSAREHSLELKKIDPALKYFNSYSATLIAGNEDDLDYSDRLSSRSVLTHCTALYLPSICAVQGRQVMCISMVHMWLECTPD